MNPNSPLSGSHLRTYNAIFQHPITHNLEWREVRNMLEKLCDVAEEPNGNLKVTRNGKVLVLHPPRSKDVGDADEVMVLRHFLEGSEAAPAPGDGKDAHWLLVIDHHEARIYHSELRGAAPQQVLPHKPEDFFRHAHNSKEFARGKEKPDPNSFFGPIAAALGGAGRILVFGSGKGTSSEMEQFIAWAKTHKPELASRIMGSHVIDENHLTPGQLLDKARQLYADAGAA
jgi:hypothetical protein